MHTAVYYLHVAVFRGYLIIFMLRFGLFEHTAVSLFVYGCFGGLFYMLQFALFVCTAVLL